MLEEWRKLLLQGRAAVARHGAPARTGLLRFFPELEALVGVPQDPEWHPEGDCWVHNQMVIDEAARLRDGGADDEALMFGALLHDVGKPATTASDDGRVRSPNHDVRGVELAARVPRAHARAARAGRARAARWSSTTSRRRCSSRTARRRRATAGSRASSGPRA